MDIVSTLSWQQCDEYQLNKAGAAGHWAARADAAEHAA
jgi:hypothetical protein